MGEQHTVRTGDDELVLRHYEQQAREHELSPTSTMADEITRDLEIGAIVGCIEHVHERRPVRRVVEVGCGNGYLLSILREHLPDTDLVGLDFSPDMVRLADRRRLERCEISEGDVRALALADRSVDLVVSERCLVNLLDEADQLRALRELHRILRPGGYLVLVEAFTDGLLALNKAREELGLDPNSPPYHNRWLDKSAIQATLDECFEPDTGDGAVAPPNFLSSHYFVSRVLYPAVTRRPVLYNTEFVRFFSHLPPIGNYSPIQLLLLRRRDRGEA